MLKFQKVGKKVTQKECDDYFGKGRVDAKLMVKVGSDLLRKDDPRAVKIEECPGIVVYNLTLHEPTPEMEEWGRKQGITIGLDGGTSFDAKGSMYFTEPLGVEVPVHARPKHVREMAEDLIHKVAIWGGKHILVGGLTDLTYHEIGYAHKLGITPYVANVERIRDKNDRFVFKFVELRPVFKNDVIEEE